ncbi:uncharacterized protein LOC127265477 [Andrographis paniculata]|uniref:uncharacterized protein LOC127265477 n=1 Tax=Andrographis paniculata TaxID=175694 RepID=UPI0021E8074D|nr:uncharacterized protein LOC127265477 [Andrographis paniculata]
MDKSSVAAAPEKEKKAADRAVNNHNHHRKIWDCGSSLYDSFELKALEKQLDSAISSRSLSMPHLSSGIPRPAAQKKPASSRISRSFQRLIRAVFRPKHGGAGSNYGSGGGFYGFYDGSGALSTIPEGTEFGGLSPEMRSLVTRTASERFTAATSVGISCS